MKTKAIIELNKKYFLDEYGILTNLETKTPKRMLILESVPYHYWVKGTSTKTRTTVMARVDWMILRHYGKLDEPLVVPSRIDDSLKVLHISNLTWRSIDKETIPYLNIHDKYALAINYILYGYTVNNAIKRCGLPHGFDTARMLRDYAKLHGVLSKMYIQINNYVSRLKKLIYRTDSQGNVKVFSSYDDAYEDTKLLNPNISREALRTASYSRRKHGGFIWEKK